MRSLVSGALGKVWLLRIRVLNAAVLFDYGFHLFLAVSFVCNLF